jgi:hypothetical protein
VRYGKYKFFTSVGLIHHQEETIDITEYFDKEEWERMSEEDRQEALNNAAGEWASDYIETWWQEVEDSN